MADIKIFVCCHQPCEVPNYPLLVPIQVGAALADAHFPGFLHDDTGDNISAKNRSYCELTAQYWAWKNIEADHYGFFHYRRYLYPDEGAKRPYIVRSEPTPGLLDKLGYGEFERLIERNDLILPKAENMFVLVREHYASAVYHHAEDLKLAERIVAERTPEMSDAMEGYLSGELQYFGNIYIMRREVFRDYCAWLFPILDEFDRRADMSGYTAQEKRADGYIAERLLGVYAAFYRGELRICEIPRVHFYPQERDRINKLSLDFLLPPGSQRRAYIKAEVRKWKEMLSGKENA